MRSGLVIAVDGPSAAGKGVISKKLGVKYDLPVLDTGLLYRAVGLKLMQAGNGPDDESAAARVASEISAADLNVPGLRTTLMGEYASQVSAFPSVRSALLQMQLAFASQPEGAILDGRDIGTVICPTADVKIFMTARSEVRAMRRYSQMRAEGDKVSYEAILQDIERRDRRDSNRSTAPLQAADDALVIDTSDMTVEEVLGAVTEFADSVLSVAGKQFGSLFDGVPSDCGPV